MFPTILQIGPLVISTTGVFTALAFFFASFLTWQKGKEEHFEEVELMDGMLLIILVSLLGSRAGFVLSQWQERIKFLDLIAHSGFSWQTALLIGLISLFFYCRRQKWDFFKVADFLVFGLTLGLILVNLGQFISVFDINQWISFVPLGASFLFFLTYFLLLHFDKNYRTYGWYKNKRGEAAPGFLLLSFLILTNLIDLIKRFLINWPQIFSLDKILNILIILLAILFFYGRSGNSNLTIFHPSFKKRQERNQNSIRFKAGMEARE